jgi:hypothetical protein
VYSLLFVQFLLLMFSQSLCTSRGSCACPRSDFAPEPMEVHMQTPILLGCSDKLIAYVTHSTCDHGSPRCADTRYHSFRIPGRALGNHALKTTRFYKIADSTKVTHGTIRALSFVWKGPVPERGGSTLTLGRFGNQKESDARSTAACVCSSFQCQPKAWIAPFLGAATIAPRVSGARTSRLTSSAEATIFPSSQSGPRRTLQLQG